MGEHTTRTPDDEQDFAGTPRPAARALIGPPLDVSAIAVERMRKLVALPVLSADALSSALPGVVVTSVPFHLAHG
jgi:hypothetical protein